MRMIVLVSRDERLAQRIRDGLCAGEALTVVHAGPSTLVRLVEGLDRVMYVVDCRGGEPGQVESDVRKLRASLGRDVCITAIADLIRDGGRRTLRAVGMLRNVVNELVLIDCDDTGAMLRAIMNDPLQCGAGAEARGILGCALPPVVARLLDEVLGGGFAVSNVAQLAKAWACNRTTIERQYTRHHAPLPSDALDLCKASYAVVAIGTTSNTAEAVCRAVGFAKTSSLHGVIHRALGSSLAACRTAAHNTSPGAALALLVADSPVVDQCVTMAAKARV